MHCGDSRLYWFREGRLVERTRDRSLVQSLADAGLLQEEEMRDHPKRSTLECALGLDESSLDLQFPDAPRPMAGANVFLLCSDGVWEHIPDVVLESLLGSSATPDEWLAGIRQPVLEATRSVATTTTTVRWPSGSAANPPDDARTGYATSNLPGGHDAVQFRHGAEQPGPYTQDRADQQHGRGEHHGPRPACEHPAVRHVHIHCQPGSGGGYLRCHGRADPDALRARDTRALGCRIAHRDALQFAGTEQHLDIELHVGRRDHVRKPRTSQPPHPEVSGECSTLTDNRFSLTMVFR